MANNWETIPAFQEQEIVTESKMNKVRGNINHLGGLIIGDGTTSLDELDTGDQIVIPTRGYQGWAAAGGISAFYPPIFTSMGSSGSGTNYLHITHYAEGTPIEVKLMYKPNGSLSGTTFSFLLYRTAAAGTIGVLSHSLTNSAMTGTSTTIQTKDLTSLYSSVIAGEMLNLRLLNNYNDSISVDIMGLMVKY